MNFLLGLVLTAFASFSIPVAHAEEPGMAPKLTKTSDDSTPKSHKWKFEQATSVELVAVVRVEHLIMGTAIESFDELAYNPEEALIGFLTVELDGDPKVPKVTFPSFNHYLRFRIDPTWEAVKERPREIDCADGKKRNARTVEIIGEHETIRVSFYTAPPESFRIKEPTLPDAKDKDTASFKHRVTSIKPEVFVIRGPGQEEEAKEVSVRPRR